MLRAFILVIVCFLFAQGCDIRGANDPYSYAPRQSDSVWQPPEKATKRLPDMSALEKDGEDYHLFSEEAPITLAEIIDISLSRSPDTKQSWAAARVSAAEYGQSLQNYFILADVDGNFTRTRYAEFAGPMRTIIYETKLRLFGYARVSTSQQSLESTVYKIMTEIEACPQQAEKSLSVVA